MIKMVWAPLEHTTAAGDHGGQALAYLPIVPDGVSLCWATALPARRSWRATWSDSWLVQDTMAASRPGHCVFSWYGRLDFRNIMSVGPRVLTSSFSQNKDSKYSRFLEAWEREGSNQTEGPQSMYYRDSVSGSLLTECILQFLALNLFTHFLSVILTINVIVLSLDRCRTERT